MPIIGRYFEGKRLHHVWANTVTILSRLQNCRETIDGKYMCEYVTFRLFGATARHKVTEYSVVSKFEAELILSLSLYPVDRQLIAQPALSDVSAMAPILCGKSVPRLHNTQCADKPVTSRNETEN